MKLLHTSDWHLGRNLYNQPRYHEFEQWLQWLVNTLQQQAIDVLIIAGDIFDTTTPTNKAQQQYYQFLLAASRTCCHHIVVVGGNHDSPTFLNAPKTLLHTLNVHVVGSAEDDPTNEVLSLYTPQGTPLGIVCAVPYLRDRDLRQYSPLDDTATDKSQTMLSALTDHYMAVCQHALSVQTQLHSQYGGYIPIVATGHLFAAGGSSVEGDGMRDLYVGSLAYVTAEVFPRYVDYVALGHLHSSQMVGGHSHIRYSGSPLPMSFAEAAKDKYVLIVEWQGTKHTIQAQAVPRFQQLQCVQGDLLSLSGQLTELVAQGDSIWVEVQYSGSEVISDLRQRLEALVANSQVSILRTKTPASINPNALSRASDCKPLSQWSELEVFEQRLLSEQPELSEEQKARLRPLYRQVLNQLTEQDSQAQ